MSNLIIKEFLELVSSLSVSLQDGDPTKIYLVEQRPRSEAFADLITSCNMGTNDPEEPGGWVHEEITKWPPKQDPFAQDYGTNFNEIGGGQGWFLRYTARFRFFYNELGTDRETAVSSSNIILSRIVKAVQTTDRFIKLKDDFGTTMVRADKAVKRYEIIPAGSSEEVNIQAKMWLQFEVYKDY